MPGIREALVLGVLTWIVLNFLMPSWGFGFLYGLVVVIGTRFLFGKLAQRSPRLLGLCAFVKQVILAGLAIAGVFLGLHPVGLVLGLALWPLSLWIWAARHVRHSR